MQGNGGTSDEDRRSGFERGGWAMGAADDATRTFIIQTYERAEAFSFGRRTYEMFAAFWGAMAPNADTSAAPDDVGLPRWFGRVLTEHRARAGARRSAWGRGRRRNGTEEEDDV